jgi:hypothetical protein
MAALPLGFVGLLGDDSIGSSPLLVKAALVVRSMLIQPRYKRVPNASAGLGRSDSREVILVANPKWTARATHAVS